MNEISPPSFWRRCSSCKNPIAFAQKYWVCSVSTCNRQRTGLAFCSVSCFDAHVPMMNHKDAGAFERRAPTLEEWKREKMGQDPKAAASLDATKNPSLQQTNTVPREILVVVSKTKEYVRTKYSLSTSDAVMEVLSDHLRKILDEASKRAIQQGRKTLMDRDFG